MTEWHGRRWWVLCSIEDCETVARTEASQLCEKHYKRVQREGRREAPVIIDRPTDTSWMLDAACDGVDPGVFFPERGEPTEPARDICMACPVRLDCLEYALAERETMGIWGGKSERERRAIRRQRREGREVA